ncbi:MAG: flagellar basal body-associated FliL family protein [Ignavibacteria bacterium]|nr:flagellar basal body-associated FliL family protein [Ignavibacteria bacterium]
MAKESTTPAPNTQTPEQPKTDKPPFTARKLLQLGIPIFVVQAVAVYFLTAKFILPATAAHDGAKTDPASAVHAAEDGMKESNPSEGGSHEATQPGEQHIYVVKDLIINPAGTNGTRFLLTTVGFNVNSSDAKKELESREMQVRDILNTILTAKGLDELTNVQLRDSLRVEIAQKVAALVRGGTLRNVYFSKFIIQ